MYSRVKRIYSSEMSALAFRTRPSNSRRKDHLRTEARTIVKTKYMIAPHISKHLLINGPMYRFSNLRRQNARAKEKSDTEFNERAAACTVNAMGRSYAPDVLCARGYPASSAPFTTPHVLLFALARGLGANKRRSFTNH